MRVVLDTNILISGLLRRGSPADRIRQAWEEQRFNLITSEWQMVELRRVSRYPRLRRLIAPHEIGRLVGRIHRHAVILDSLPTIEASLDPDDNPLIATAVAGKAEFLVTGDKSDLLGLGKVRGVRFVTARNFIEMLEK